MSDRRSMEDLKTEVRSTKTFRLQENMIEKKKQPNIAKFLAWMRLAKMSLRR